MKIPHIDWRALVWGALLVGCGSSAGSGGPSPDASTGDVSAGDASTGDAVADEGPAVGPDGAGAVEDATEETPGQSPDADNCAGVRCAAPPPCGQPCTTPCCCNRTCPPDGGPDAAAPTGDAATADAGAACVSPGDCRVFSYECTGCDCIAVAVGAADPVCPGPGVECLIDPCNGKSAACVSGHCAVAP